MNRKKSFIENVEFAGAYLGINIIKYIPLDIAYFLNMIISGIFFICDHKHRDRSIQHIKHSGIINNHFNAAILALKNFNHIGKVLIEFIKFKTILNACDIKKYVGCNVSKNTEKAMFDPRGTIIVSGHYGNWEMAGFAIAAIFKPIVCIGRELNNKKINEYVFSNRKKLGMEIYSKKGGMKKLLKGLREKKCIGIAIDQHPGDGSGVAGLFFNQPCNTHETPALLHIRTGAPIVLAACKRKVGSKMNFELILSDPINIPLTGDLKKDKKNITIKINYELEKIIKNNPEQWLWPHRRWLNLNRKIDDLTNSRIKEALAH